MYPQITTKKGDTGLTDLWSGKRVSKTDQRIIAVGKIDTLSAQIGIIKAGISISPVSDLSVAMLKEVQLTLIKIMGLINSDNGIKGAAEIETKLSELEYSIGHFRDYLTSKGVTMKDWVLYGSNLLSAHLDFASKLCREAEIECCKLKDNDVIIDPVAIKYMNRLSDFLFLMARTYEI
jgi:cob(I)alamin adenosyltransferase